jgi:hypothetical protein
MVHLTTVQRLRPLPWDCDALRFRNDPKRQFSIVGIEVEAVKMALRYARDTCRVGGELSADRQRRG